MELSPAADDDTGDGARGVADRLARPLPAQAGASRAAVEPAPAAARRGPDRRGRAPTARGGAARQRHPASRACRRGRSRRRASDGDPQAGAGRPDPPEHRSPNGHEATGSGPAGTCPASRTTTRRARCSAAPRLTTCRIGTTRSTPRPSTRCSPTGRPSNRLSTAPYAERLAVTPTGPTPTGRRRTGSYVADFPAHSHVESRADEAYGNGAYGSYPRRAGRRPHGPASVRPGTVLARPTGGRSRTARAPSPRPDLGVEATAVGASPRAGSRRAAPRRRRSPPDGSGRLDPAAARPRARAGAARRAREPRAGMPAGPPERAEQACAPGRRAEEPAPRGAHASDRPRHGGHRAVGPGDDLTGRSARRHASAHGRHSEERDDVARADRPRHRRPEH